MRYEIVTGKTVEELAAKVNQRLEKGWQLHGNVFMTGTGFFQAIIKDD